MNENDEFRETYVSFQRNAAEFHFKVEEIEGFVAFDADDFYEEQEADETLQRMTDEIMNELGLTTAAVPQQPVEEPDVETDKLVQRLAELTAN